MSKTNRNFWDFATEEPWGLFLALIGVALIMAAIFQ